MNQRRKKKNSENCHVNTAHSPHIIITSKWLPLKHKNGFLSRKTNPTTSDTVFFVVICRIFILKKEEARNLTCYLQINVNITIDTETERSR